MRPYDDDAPGVEFLVPTDVTWEDEFDRGAGRAGPPERFGTPLLRRGFVAAVVLLLGGALVIRTATSHDSYHSVAASPTPSASVPLPAPSSPDPIEYQLDVRTGGAVHVITIPTEVKGCPADGCLISDRVPDGFVRAVQGRLRVSTPTQMVEVEAAPNAQPIYRQLTAAGPDRTTVVVTVRKQRGGLTTTSGTKQTSTKVIGSVSYPTGTSGFVVTVEVTGPLGWTPPLDAMTALAADPRLLGTG